MRYAALPKAILSLSAGVLTLAGLLFAVTAQADTVTASPAAPAATLGATASTPPRSGTPSPGTKAKSGARPAAATRRKPTSSADDPKGKTPPEYKRPTRWGLTAGASQRHDWLTGKDRFRLNEEINAKTVLGMPEWLEGSLEQRTRYESYDTPWRRNQKSGEDQIPLQTVLWLEAHKDQFRAGFEFWNAVQSGAQPGWWLNNTMVNTADFTQMYAAWTDTNIADSGLGFEAKGGRMTLDLGSRRLVARNNFRNTTNTFTGVQFRLRDATNKWHLLAFANQPVERLPRQADKLIFNDYAWDQEQEGSVFAGAMLDTWDLPWSINAELYLYYLKSELSSQGQEVVIDRELVTPGLRIHRAAKKGEFDFEAETVGQTGQANGTFRLNGREQTKLMDAESFFEHIQLGYTFDLPFDPRLMVQYDYATAGNDGRTTNSFDTLFGARRWEYGPTGIFGPFGRNNINSPGARVFLVPHRDLTSFVAYRAYWMANASAPWVIANLWDPTGKSGDFLGQTVEFALRWDPHDNLAFEVGWETLIKGEFARNAPGAPSDHDNVNYFFLQSEIRF
jgi:hypothetical protein